MTLRWGDSVRCDAVSILCRVANGRSSQCYPEFREIVGGRHGEPTLSLETNGKGSFWVLNGHLLLFKSNNRTLRGEVYVGPSADGIGG